jgi:hypothetical protein
LYAGLFSLAKGLLSVTAGVVVGAEVVVVFVLGGVDVVDVAGVSVATSFFF